MLHLQVTQAIHEHSAAEQPVPQPTINPVRKFYSRTALTLTALHQVERELADALAELKELKDVLQKVLSDFIL